MKILKSIEACKSRLRMLEEKKEQVLERARLEIRKYNEVAMKDRRNSNFFYELARCSLCSRPLAPVVEKIIIFGNRAVHLSCKNGQ